MVGKMCTDHNNDGSVWLYYQNTRGLRTKIDELFLTTRECNFDIIILTETGLDDRINSLQLFGTSFNVYRCDRSVHNSNKSSFGGVLIAVAQCHHSSLIETVNGDSLEQVCVRATVRGTKLLLCGVYIPPDRSQDVNVIDAHISSIGELSGKSTVNDIVFVCGDYNQPRIMWMPDSLPASDQLPAASATLIDGTDFFNLKQQNFQRNHNDRTLDLIFCSSEHRLTVDSCITPLLPVDRHHPPLTIKLPNLCSNSAASVSAESITRSLNYRKIDFVALEDYLLGFDWTFIYPCTDVDDMTAHFCDVIIQWLNVNVPLVKRPNNPAWCTRRLRDLKRFRNNAQRKYRRLKTLITKRNFKSASDEYRRLNSELYKSVASNFDAEIAAAAVPAGSADLTTFEVTTDLILSAAKKLKRSYSPGPDGIPAIIISRCATVLANPLRSDEKSPLTPLTSAITELRSEIKQLYSKYPRTRHQQLVLDGPQSITAEV
ncbi:uncharacterized protein LOC129728406 [Wyeomyia smithii]|uniref:uncharacterized protein LOC129728406 n=1 Tax=Wyeomyia smithii TaxID=174621 RepID=UPI002467FE22|nr:uncharacterized protein LOC129728406 [Wyeomyia smithii]